MIRYIEKSDNEMIGSSLVLVKDISAQWPKITNVEAEDVKTAQSLSVQVAKCYNLSQAQAEADVKAWLAERTF
ncbi:MAG TPA: hypothetical protein VIL09_10650 [Microvirga sp.]